MAASISDKITKTFNSTNPNVATVTNNRTALATTLNCDNLAGWPTDTAVHFSTYKIDVDSTVVPGSQIDWKGIVTGNDIGSLTRVAGATDSGNDIGDIVEMNPTANWANDTAEALLVKHEPDGSFKAGAVGTADVDDEAITEPKLGDEAVSTRTLAQSAVTPEKRSGGFYFVAQSLSSGAGTKTVTGVPFKPKAVIILGTNLGSGSGPTFVSGYACDGSPIVQGSNYATGSGSGSSTSVACVSYNSTATLDYSAAVTAFTSDGITLNATTATNTRVFHMLFLG